jgi:DNA-binding IclR family transcriptional regulator
MARPAPAVDRAVDVLDFLADNPRDTFSLSELARRLELNKASAHATLNALVDRGYLLRHPVRKDYRLGPRLIAVGEAAREQYPVVEFARDELRRLSEDVGTECVASAPIGDEMVIVDQAGPVRPIGLSVAVGHRFPLVPPMGTIFMAWSSPAEIDEWLRRVGPGVGEAELERYRGALATVRERGYSAGRDGDEYQLLDLRGAEDYRMTTMGAPVFDAEGTVAMGIFVLAFRDALTPDQVPDVAERLIKATDAITESIHGRHPR